MSGLPLVGGDESYEINMALEYAVSAPRMRG